jgi:hypothetical protein
MLVLCILVNDIYLPGKFTMVYSNVNIYMIKVFSNFDLMQRRVHGLGLILVPNATGLRNSFLYTCMYLS